MEKQNDKNKVVVEQKGNRITVNQQIETDLNDMFNLFTTVLVALGYVIPDPVKYHLDFVDENGEKEKEE